MLIRLVSKFGNAEHCSALTKAIFNGRAMLGVPRKSNVSTNRISMVSSCSHPGVRFVGEDSQVVMARYADPAAFSGGVPRAQSDESIETT